MQTFKPKGGGGGEINWLLTAYKQPSSTKKIKRELGNTATRKHYILMETIRASVMAVIVFVCLLLFFSFLTMQNAQNN